MEKIFYQYLAIYNNENMPNGHKKYRVASKIGQILNKPSKIYQILQEFGQKANFCQVCSHWSWANGVSCLGDEIIKEWLLASFIEEVEASCALGYFLTPLNVYNWRL